MVKLIIQQRYTHTAATVHLSMFTCHQFQTLTSTSSEIAVFCDLRYFSSAILPLVNNIPTPLAQHSCCHAISTLKNFKT